MDYSFDRMADRSGAVPWLKDYFTPEQLHQAHMIGYAGAEFEFATCPAFSRGVERAARKGVFGYTLVGEPYRGAVQWWMQQLRDYPIQPNWVLPTHGTIFSLASSIRLLTRPGENIIVLPPSYNRYDQAAERLQRGTTRVPLRAENGHYHIDWTALEEAFAQPENRLLVLCNPNNPTGHVYSQGELRQIAALSARYHVPVFSDEIFAEIVFPGSRAIPYTQVAGPDALAITCTSMGKVFSLTGVNHANVIIENPELRERYLRQRDADHFGSVDPMVYAGLMEAYSPEGRDWVLALREYLWQNVQIMEDFLHQALPDAVMARPQGTFVLWVDYSAYADRWEQLDTLLRREGMLVGDPGEEYGGKPTCVRYSIAVPHEQLQRTLARTARALADF